MLRNLVTSLFEHEQIKTTLPKAKDTARLAEKIITLGKRGDIPAHRRASAFVLKPAVLPKIFGTFANRYAERPGGYTRIHKFGNRQGDNAPHAILELVDNPRDLRMELTARSIGWELLRENLQKEKPMSLINRGVQLTKEFMENERSLGAKDEGQLRPKTRWNLQKVLKYRDESASSEVGRKVGDYIDLLLAKPMAFKRLHDSLQKKPPLGRKYFSPRVGQAMPGESRGALELVKGAVIRPKCISRSHRSEKNARSTQQTPYTPS
jgi:ribosomal protein L17